MYFSLDCLYAEEFFLLIVIMSIEMIFIIISNFHIIHFYYILDR